MIPRGELLLVGGSYYLRPPDAPEPLEVAAGGAEIDRLRRNRAKLAGTPLAARHKGGGGGAGVDGCGPLLEAKTWVGRRPVRSGGLRVEVSEREGARSRVGTF